MTVIGLFAIIFALLLLFIVGGVFVAGLVAGFQHGRWGLLIALGLITAVPAVLVLLGVSYARVQSQPTHRKDNRSVTVTVSEPRVSASATFLEPVAEPVSPSAPAQAEVVSDEELLAIASPDPVIEIGEEEVAAEAEVKSDRAEWLNGPLDDDQRRFVSGPYATLEQCRDDAREQLAQWAWSVVASPGDKEQRPADFSFTPSELARLTEATEAENRSTSVGDVKLLHTLGEIDDEEKSRLTARYTAWRQEHRRTTGIRTVTIGGGLLLGAVGLLHGVLRSGGRSETT